MKTGTKFSVLVPAALVAVVLGPGWARAEVSANQQIVSLDLGAAVPFAKTSSQAGNLEAANPGFFGGAQYIYQVTPQVGVGADFGYSDYSGKTRTGVSNFDPAATVQGSLTKVHGEALGRYVFMAESRFNPYAIMGLGFNTVSLKSVFNSPKIPLDETVQEASYTSFAFSVGGGLETEIIKSVIVGCEARWRYLGNHAFGPTDAAVASHTATATQTFAFGPASEVTLALRVGYKFGGK